MKILIVAATIGEIEKIKKLVETDDQNSFKNLTVDFLITGIGMIATTYQLTKKISSNTYDLVLNTGIAGSFNREIKIGEVLNVISDCFSELGAQDGSRFLTLNEIGLQEEIEFPFENGKINSNSNIKTTSLEKLKKVNGITVNTVHGNENSILECISIFNPTIESMEGASVFYVCRFQNIPCLQIRSISNYVENRNKENWNIPLAIDNLNLFLNNFLTELNAYGN